MSRARTAATPKTKRRDGDPVRVYADGRLWYWTGGRPGSGDRVPERHRTMAEAEERAAKLRERLARTRGLGPKAAKDLDQVMRDMLLQLEEAGDPQGSIRQYRSNWNTWVPEEVGKVSPLDIGPPHWAQIFDYANANKASEQTVKSIARTLGTFIDWAVDHGYFASAEPFGEQRRRKAYVKKARKRARVFKAEGENRYLFDTCPRPEDIEKYAAAFEEVYPGYGYRLVMLAWATGLRFGEVLALRHDSFDLASGEVAVDWQLDRYQNWPAVRRPKGGKTRVTILWAWCTDIAQSLIEDSLALPEGDPHHGWLFPRHRSTTKWSDQAGKLAKAAADACQWEWTFHWLRHAFATHSLARKKSGGYKLDPVSVQNWLGHTRLSTTYDMYVERQNDDVKTAKARTGRRPGHR